MNDTLTFQEVQEKFEKGESVKIKCIDCGKTMEYDDIPEVVQNNQEFICTECWDIPE